MKLFTLNLTLLTLLNLPSFAQGTLEYTEYLGDSLEVNYYKVAQNLILPWEMIEGPDGKIWITHDKGTITSVEPQTGAIKDILELPDIAKNSGITLSRMVGLVLDTDFENHPYVYTGYNYRGTAYNAPKGYNLYLKLVRYEYDDASSSLINPLVLIDGIEIYDGYHVGGKLLMDENRMIFWTIGDAKQPENPENHPNWPEDNLPIPQDLDIYNGKVLRIHADGTVPTDNPFATEPYDLTPRNLIYSFGHRNTQGLSFGPNGTLYYSEHGGTLEDEIGIIQPGGNYGWPFVEGFCNELGSLFDETVHCDTATNNVEPIYTWNPDIGPTSIEYLAKGISGYFKNSLLAPTLTSEDDGLDLRLLLLNEDGSEVINEITLIDEVFGRMRDVCVLNDGSVYVCTSNTMWGETQTNDEKILRIEIKPKTNTITQTPDEAYPFSIAQDRLKSTVSIKVKSTANYQLLVHTLDGKVIMKDNLIAEDNSYHLKNGIYILRIYNDNESFSRKLIMN